MAQPLASQVSAPKPLNNQKHRSSLNFQFLEVPVSGDIRVTIEPGSIICNLKKDTGIDPVIAELNNGGTFQAKDVKTDTNYYLADPEDATTNFVVIFSEAV